MTHIERLVLRVAIGNTPVSPFFREEVNFACKMQSTLKVGAVSLGFT